tara:strand:+ start:68 stop:355 length:288 start_codon:yes stop_codon:yes gene_type:complete
MTFRSIIIQALLATMTVVNAARSHKATEAPKVDSTSLSKDLKDDSEGLDEDGTAIPRIMYWVTPFFVSAFLLFVFMLLIFNVGIGLLNDVRVPSY